MTISQAIRAKRVQCNRGVFKILVLDSSAVYVALFETRRAFTCGVWGKGN